MRPIGRFNLKDRKSFIRFRHDHSANGSINHRAICTSLRGTILWIRWAVWSLVASPPRWFYVFLEYHVIFVRFCLANNERQMAITYKLMVSCQKGPSRHAYAWQIGPYWQDTLVFKVWSCCWLLTAFSRYPCLSHYLTRKLIHSSWYSILLHQQNLVATI